MKNVNHPYKRYEGSPLWHVLEEGVKALARNGDIQERTSRQHIVGYLSKLLDESGQLAAEEQSDDPDIAHPVRISRPKRQAI